MQTIEFDGHELSVYEFLHSTGSLAPIFYICSSLNFLNNLLPFNCYSACPIGLSKFTEFRPLKKISVSFIL